MNVFQSPFLLSFCFVLETDKLVKAQILSTKSRVTVWGSGAIAMIMSNPTYG